MANKPGADDESAPPVRPLDRRAGSDLAEAPDDPPVVARLVVEIRSDGSRTIARGAMEDVQSGERVAIEAKGTTPLALASSLAKTMFGMPVLAGTAVRQLLGGRRRRRAHRDPK